MSHYTLDQWVLFFFFYCLCGWIWESCYVSVCQRHWVNRGFLHGPLLPIYGSGALIILLSTIQVQHSLSLIFLFGMIAATLLEYVTGAAMEKLFKVRYWDYSKKRFNLHGHICLSSTLAWGAFSILLVRFVHPPVERLLLRIPGAWTEPIVFALVAAFTVDLVQSVRAALNLRDILTRLAEENEDLQRLAKRAEVIAAFAEEDLRQFRERTEVEKLLLQERLERDRARRQESRDLRVLRWQEQLEESLRRSASVKLAALQTVTETLQSARERLENARDLTAESIQERRAEIDEALDKLRLQEARIRTRTAKTYYQALRILRGNPSASAGTFGTAMEHLRSLSETRRSK